MQRESWNSRLGRTRARLLTQASSIMYTLRPLLSACHDLFNKLKIRLAPPVFQEVHVYWNWASYWISSQYLPSFRRWTNLSVLAVCQYLAICKRLAYIHLFPLWLGFLLSLKEEKAAMALYLLPLAQRQTSIYFTLSSPMMFSCSNVYTHVTSFSTGNLLHISTNNYSSYFFEYWRRSIGL